MPDREDLPPLPEEEFREAIEIEVDLLADRQDAIPQLASWYVKRWPDHYGQGGPGNANQDLASWSQRDELPITMVAMLDGRVSGTVTLKRRALASHNHLFPWLTMLLVPPAFTDKGVEMYLVLAVEDLAKRLGFEAVYTSSGVKSAMLIRRSWIIAEEVDEGGQDLFIYKRIL